jgi:hypothetical protein
MNANYVDNSEGEGVFNESYSAYTNNASNINNLTSSTWPTTVYKIKYTPITV